MLMLGATVASKRKRTSVTIRAAWIGGAFLLAATILAWLLGGFSGIPVGQSAQANSGGTAVNITGSDNTVQIGTTRVAVAATWSEAERRLLSKMIDEVVAAVESHNWTAIQACYDAEDVAFQRDLDVDWPQFIEELLGLNTAHNHLGRQPDEAPSIERLARIQTMDITGIATPRTGIAEITGLATLADKTQRDIHFRLQIVDGRFRFRVPRGQDSGMALDSRGRSRNLIAYEEEIRPAYQARNEAGHTAP